MSITAFRPITYVLVLFLLAAVTAFAQAPGKGADAATIVSKAELELTLGVKLKDGVKNPAVQNPGILSSCDWEMAQGMGQVGVLLRRNSTKYVPGTEKAEFEKQKMKLQYITGLGTTAAFIDTFGMGIQLIVFRGDYDYLQLSTMATGVDNKTLQPRLEKLAHVVLERWK